MARTRKIKKLYSASGNFTEEALTKTIRNLLDVVGIWHYKQHQGLGSTPGIPDIVGIWRGRYLGIEIKTKLGVVSDVQKRVMANINDAGGKAFIARSVDDVIRELELGDRFLDLK